MYNVQQQCRNPRGNLYSRHISPAQNCTLPTLVKQSGQSGPQVLSVQTPTSSFHVALSVSVHVHSNRHLHVTSFFKLFCSILPSACRRCRHQRRSGFVELRRRRHTRRRVDLHTPTAGQRSDELCSVADSHVAAANVQSNDSFNTAFSPSDSSSFARKRHSSPDSRQEHSPNIDGVRLNCTHRIGTHPTVKAQTNLHLRTRSHSHYESQSSRLPPRRQRRRRPQDRPSTNCNRRSPFPTDDGSRIAHRRRIDRSHRRLRHAYRSKLQQTMTTGNTVEHRTPARQIFITDTDAVGQPEIERHDGSPRRTRIERGNTIAARRFPNG